MKEITRIHIAKTPYDVETGAKKALETYLKSLEAYSADTEIINDVEIRITEILSERGVQKNGVITEADVTALKEQLGEPREFMGDGDMAVGEEDVEKMTAEPSRKLFRDTDRAVLGGVLAGLAAFTKVDVMWVRLIFIIVALASFGTALLVYVVLWLAVPAARTAADKLQMSGRPVTVTSIRDLNEHEPAAEKKPGNGQRVALSLLGAMFVFGALIAAGIVMAALVSVVFVGHWQDFNGMAGAESLKVAFWLAVTSGVLFTALMVLSAYASFARKLTKRVAISGGVIIFVGMATFATGIGMAKHGSDLNREQVQQNTHEAALALPANARGATSLVAAAPGMTVEYIVDEKQPSHATTSLFAYEGHDMPVVTATMKNGVLTIDGDGVDGSCPGAWCMGGGQTVTVYGPALESVTASEGTTLNYDGQTQAALEVTAKENAHVDIVRGTVKRLTVTAGRDSSVAAPSATVQDVTSHLGASAQLELGMVKSLAVTDQDSCPSGEREARVGVWGVTSDELTFNGKKQAAKNMDSGCTEIEIEKEMAE